MTQPPAFGRPRYPYDHWMESTGIPVYRGHFVADPLKAELGWWEERQTHAAFIQLEGQQGVSEARITEIAPGITLPPLKMGVGEIVYVLEGQGIATVWAGEGPKKTFEWGKHSLFHLPRHCYHQLGNMSGDRPARLLNYNHLPVAMSAVPDPAFFFNNPYEAPDRLYGSEEYYSEAKMIREAPDSRWREGRAVWNGNFFPDMLAWDKLIPFWGRGAGGHVVQIQFPGAAMRCHMSVFDPQLYKKAHRHGPGRTIVIPGGEGYSVLWPRDEGAEKVVCPWTEGTIFTPPDNWYHQHFNTGGGSARYLALAPIPQFQGSSYSHQIEYPDEDPWIRQRFEAELAKHNLECIMPDEAYQDRDFEWDYGDDN